MKILRNPSLDFDYCSRKWIRSLGFSGPYLSGYRCLGSEICLYRSSYWLGWWQIWRNKKLLWFLCSYLNTLFIHVRILALFSLLSSLIYYSLLNNCSLVRFYCMQLMPKSFFYMSLSLCNADSTEHVYLCYVSYFSYLFDFCLFFFSLLVGSS